jgi:PAS domain S-box-containing protein
VNRISIKQKVFLGGRLSPFNITVIYAIIGSLWIILSDRLLVAFIHDANILTQFQTYKGWFYIIATGWILYLLINRYSIVVQREIADRTKSESALQESRTRIRMMLEQMGAVLWTTDGDLRFTSFMGAGLADLNIRTDQVVGQTLLEFFHTDDPDFLEIAAHRRALKGESVTNEQIWADKTYQTHLEPLRDAVGNIIGVIGVSMNISERVNAEEALLRKLDDLAALYEASHELLNQISADTILKKTCSLAVERFDVMFCWAGLINTEDFNVHPAVCHGVAEDYLQSIHITWDNTPFGKGPTGTAIRTGQPVAVNRMNTDPAYQAWRDQALKRGFRSSAALPLLYKGKSIGVLNVYSPETEYFTAERLQVLQSLANITAITLERARLYEHTQGYAAELEKRVAARTTELNERMAEAERLNKALANLLEDLQAATRMLEHANRELKIAKENAECADRLKSAFLATMSHELRTPLNSIIGFTGIMLQGLSGPLNDEQVKQLSMVKNSGRHLLNLINDVLDISKIEAGQLEIITQPFSMRQAVESAVQVVAPLVGKKTQALFVEIAPSVDRMVSDQRRVEQILINLLNNAVKFTPESGEIRLTAKHVTDSEHLPAHTGRHPTGNFIEISVSDTGIGIKPEDQDILFRPFHQIDTGLTRQYEGTGLGLSICKRLVEMLGGEIRAKSDGQGKGSMFTFMLPLN